MPDRATIAGLLAAVAILLLTISAYFFQPATQALAGADAFMLMGGALLGLSLFLVRRRDIGLRQHIIIQETQSPPVRWGVLGAGVLCLLALGEINGQLLNPRQPELFTGVSIHIQMLLLAVGLVLVTIGLMGIKSTDGQRVRRIVRENQRESLIFVLIMVAALIIRGWQLHDQIRALVDEPHMIQAINDLHSNPDTAILTPFNKFAAFTWLYPYVQMLSSDVLSPSIEAFRLVSVVVGTLTVAGVYGLARLLVNRPVAQISALLMATYPPHIHFSRIGLVAITDPFFGLMALLFIAWGLHTRSRRYWVVAGIMLGMLPYFSDGGRLLFPVLVVLWMVWSVLFSKARPSVRNLIWLVIAALLVAMPFIYTQYAYDAAYLGRLESKAVESDYWWLLLFSGEGVSNFQSYFRNHVMPPIMHYLFLPDFSPIFYLGDTALILSPLLPLFLAGVFHALWRPRFGGFLFLMWILLTVMGNSLLVDPVWTPRYVVSFPAVAILLAIGLYEGGRLMMLVRSRLTRARFGWALVIVIAIVQLVYYFGPHLTTYRYRSPIWRDYYDVIFRVRDLPPEAAIHVYHYDAIIEHEFPTLFEYFGMTQDFIVRPSRDAREITNLEKLPDDKPVAFFVESYDLYTIGVLHFFYELPPPQFSPYNVPREKQYALYYVEAGSRRTEPLKDYLEAIHEVICERSGVLCVSNITITQ